MFYIQYSRISLTCKIIKNNKTKGLFGWVYPEALLEQENKKKNWNKFLHKLKLAYA